MSAVMRARRIDGPAAASALVTSRRGVVLMARTQRLMNALGEAEQASLADRYGAVRNRYRTMSGFVWAAYTVRRFLTVSGLSSSRWYNSPPHLSQTLATLEGLNVR